MGRQCVAADSFSHWNAYTAEPSVPQLQGQLPAKVLGRQPMMAQEAESARLGWSSWPLASLWPDPALAAVGLGGVNLLIDYYSFWSLSPSVHLFAFEYKLNKQKEDNTIISLEVLWNYIESDKKPIKKMNR